MKVLQQALVSLQNSQSWQLQQPKRPNNTLTYAKAAARSTRPKNATTTTVPGASVTALPVFQQSGEPRTNDAVPGGAEPIRISKPKKFVKVAGARKVWGTMSETTVKGVTGIISKLCSIKSGLKIKRKVQPGGQNHKPRWWFVIHAEEDNLCTLEAEWPSVSEQTQWKLLPCYKPIFDEPESVSASPESPAPLNETIPGPDKTNSGSIVAPTKDTQTLSDLSKTTVLPNNAPASSPLIPENTPDSGDTFLELK